MKANWGRLGFCFSLAALLATSSSSSIAQTKDPIKIGFVTEISGPWSFYGTSCILGLKMATEEINAAGGVLNRPLEFIIQDNQTNPTAALAASRNLDVNDNVVALSGPTSSDTALAIYGYAEQQKIPFLVPVAAFTQLTKPGTRYTFRIEPDAVGWGYAIAKFIEFKKPNANVAAMYSDVALMRAILAGLKYQGKLSNLNIVADVVFPQGTSDATVQAARVRAQNPDFIVVSGAGGFDNVLTNQLLDLGFRSDQIIHPFGVTTQIFGWGPRSVGSYYGTFFDVGLDKLTDDGKNFIKRFDAANNRPPSQTENYCYTTPYLFKQAIELAGSVDREKLRDALSRVQAKEKTTGVPIVFDKNGARKEYMYFQQLLSVDGKRTYTSKQIYYIEWDPEVIPVYDLAK
jgi:branched-chain amino acid transport system substrate-binding protein